MAGKDSIAVIAEQIGLALSPLEIMLSSDEIFSAFMLELGWNTKTTIATIKNLGAIASDIINAVENGLDATQALNAVSQIVNFFNSVSQLSSASGLPSTIDPAEFASDFPGQLVDYLIGRYLLNNSPI